MLFTEHEAFSENDVSSYMGCENSVDDNHNQNKLLLPDDKQQLVDFFSTLLEIELEKKESLCN